MNPKRPKKFKELEAQFYSLLADTGFDDIEDVSQPDRPLKEWHSRKFCTRAARERQEYAIERQASREKYEKQISDFLNAGQLEEICQVIVAHGRNSIDGNQVAEILELHRAGKSERAIAEKIGCGKDAVHRALKKARTWMQAA